MMEGLGSNMGLLGRIPGMKNLGMARAAAKMARGGGMMPGMGLPGFPPGMGLPGMGLPGMGGGDEGESMTRMKPLSAAEKNARKAARKREKEARRRSRR